VASRSSGERVDGGTAASGGAIRVLPEIQTTNALARRAGALRDEVGLLGSDVQDVHRGTQRLELGDRTALFVKSDPHDLLEGLGSTWGLSWSSTGKLVGVSGTAIRKWRRGEKISPENRLQLARLYAFLEMLSEYPIGDPTSWMEVRISVDATVTPLDLYKADRTDLLFDLASARLGPHAVLDAFDSDWRATHARDSVYTVVTGPDGEPAIAERLPGVGRTPPATPHG
jgi:hypothetical protein